MKHKVGSDLKSIRDLISDNTRYNIPRYQRLYVWEEEQINTMLEDIYTACVTHKALFYLGGIITVKQDKDEALYDLIDGQQRFTTLWLLSLELGGLLLDFTQIDGELRLNFSIRDSVTAYFRDALDNVESTRELDVTGEGGSLSKIINARNLIKAFISKHFKSDDDKLSSFRFFILENVKLIVSNVPADTDLNKLFEVINNRGLQLQHHEILKSRILSFIVSTKRDRVRYGKIWNGCADMNNYIEKNISNEAGCNVAGYYNQYTGTFIFKDLLKVMSFENDEVESMKLSLILSKKKAVPVKVDDDFKLPEHPDVADDELEPVRSILTFPQLLLHTLRIYLFKSDQPDLERINEKELLQTFGVLLSGFDEFKAKAFIELLWNIRVAFDKHVIKWVTVGANEEIHLIKPIYKQNQKKGGWTYYLRRNKATGHHGLTLLQGMLYHSQQITTHYWLTPFLYKALSTNNADELYRYLIQLDNALFCTSDVDNLPERTRKYLGKQINTASLRFDISDLDEAAGTAFWHYWFYKLEFILWYLHSKHNTEWQSYRITSKNSVEHISPQRKKEQDYNRVSDKCLNTFGNLALVSRNFNSEFSNNEYNVKRQQFLNKKQGGKIESLKLDVIYRHGTWGDVLCDSHGKEMKKVFIDYFTEHG